MENLRNESLKVRNELIEKIKNECNVRLGFSFNDLYWINNKKVEVRRLKGYLSNNEVWYNGNIEKYNKKFKEVKKYVESLEYKDFKIELNKIRNNYKNEYYKNFSINNNLNYKEYCNKIDYNESCLILKISYNI
jgi:hypothetical protein